MPTDTYADGSPRYDHGHNPETGETWWVDTLVGVGPRHCPACGHDHSVLTTCRECEACRQGDLVELAEEVFADLLPSGTEADAALVRHDRDLRLRAACDGTCGVPDCRRPYVDQSGLIRFGYDRESTVLPARSRTPLLDLPVEEDDPPSAWMVDR